MDDATTNSGATLHQITDANARLISTTTKQYDIITRLIRDLKLQSASPRTSDITRNQIPPIQ